MHFFRFALRQPRPLQAQLFLVLLTLIALFLPTASQAQVAFNGVQTTLGSGFNSPYNVALDGSGNVFVADYGNGLVKEILAAGGYMTVKTVGSGFSQPSGVAVDGSGNVFVADPGNNGVYEILAAGGYTAVIPIGSGFNQPFSVALDGSGNLFVADTFNNVVKEILAAGGYTTINTLPGAFSEPFGVALDESGNLYVADTGDGEITEVTEVMAQGGYTTVNVLASGFNDPSGVAVDVSGNVLFTDSANNALKELVAVNSSIPTSPTIMTLGSGFAHPYGLAVDADEDVFIADLFNNRVEELALDSVNFGSQAIGSPSTTISLPFTIAPTASTTVGNIAITTMGATGQDFTDAGASTCTAAAYASATSCVVNVNLTPLASGLRRGAVTFYDGSGNVLSSVPIYGIGTGPQVAFLPGSQSTLASGSFTNPNGVAVDASGNLFVADSTKTAINEILAAGGYTTVKKVGAGFSQPSGVALDGSGNIFVADTGNGDVKEILAAGGYAVVNSVGSGFGQPSGVAVDGNGNVFVADAGKSAVFELLASSGYTSVKSLGSGFNNPGGVALDSNGNLFVADSGNGVVKEILAAGGYTTVSKVGSGFSRPSGVAVDASGSVYVADASNNGLYEILAGAYTTVNTLASGLKAPVDVAVDGSGNVFVADSGDATVKRLDFADAPSLSFASTLVGTTSTDSPRTVQMRDIGNQPLTLTGINYPADFPEGGADASACTGSTVLIPAQQCDLPVDFTPLSATSLSESVTLTDNALNLVGATQTISVSGTGQNRSTVTWATPASITYGTPLTAAQLDATASVPGTFIYTPAAGTVLTVDSHILSVNFTPTNAGSSSSITAQVTLQVNKATPALSWTPASVQLGQSLGAAQLDATANVPGTFAYTPSSGTTITTSSQTLSVLFTPTDTADYNTASLSVSLTVTSGPIASISPSSVDFGTVYLGSISLKNVIVTNVGGAPMTVTDPILSIVQGGNSQEFIAVNLCFSPLAPGKSCTITIAFLAGPFYNQQTATLNIMDNAPGTPQKVALSALVMNPQAQLSSTSLSFATQKVGTTSAAKTVLLTNTGSTALTISNIAATGANPLDFAPTSNCPKSLAVKASCTVSLAFRPAAKGSRSASIAITDNVQSGSQSFSVSGTGN
jgi:sugar lactone lactonase YvrE